MIETLNKVWGQFMYLCDLKAWAQMVLNTLFFFYSWLSMMSVRADIPNMVISRPSVHPSGRAWTGDQCKMIKDYIDVWIVKN